MCWTDDIKEKNMSEYLEMLNDVRKIRKGIGAENHRLAKKYKQKFYTGRIIISDTLKSMRYTYDFIPIAEQFEKFVKCDWGEGGEMQKLMINI